MFNGVVLSRVFEDTFLSWCIFGIHDQSMLDWKILSKRMSFFVCLCNYSTMGEKCVG